MPVLPTLAPGVVRMPAARAFSLQNYFISLFSLLSLLSVVLVADVIYALRFLRHLQ